MQFHGNITNLLGLSKLTRQIGAHLAAQIKSIKLNIYTMAVYYGNPSGIINCINTQQNANSQITFNRHLK